MDRCEKCGEPIQIGSWPFCKGGHGRGTNNVIGDEIDEWNENVGHEPVHFTSRQERRRYLKEHGLQEFVRHVGEQGSDKNPRTSRWI
jgi:hypothetical protein